MQLIDSHCHLPMIEAEGGIEEILANAHKNAVTGMLCVSIDMESFPEVLKLAQAYENVQASVGVHPNIELNGDIDTAQMIRLAQDPAIVAIGETGLDYFRSQGDLEWQRKRFRDHIHVAKTVNKPLIVHSREAKQDVIDVLREERADQVGGVMHCFVDDIDTAMAAIELNFYISFSGIVTFKNAMDLKAVARQVPEDRILIETDSPYLAPLPYRGKQNQPAFVRHVAEHMAELREVSLERIAEASTANYKNLFIN
jgi:TatD DNase family protein